jgi:glycosyltransferase involved in cell wall biosynthesis
MHVLHVTGAAVVGGVELVQSSYIDALHAHGVSSERFVYRAGPMLSAFQAICPVHLDDGAGLGPLAAQGRFDLVHLTVSGLRLGAMEELARHGYRGGLVVSCHGSFSGVVSSRTTSVVTVVSRWLGDQARDFCDLEPVVLYNGIDLGVFNSHGDEPKPSQPVIAWVGRTQDPIKGFPEFLRIMSRPALSGCEAWIADADGVVDAAQLSRSCGRPVRVWHRLSYTGMAAFYRQVARSGGALLSTSYYDSTPLVMLEAMACGCPVVAPGVGGIPEMLNQGRWGVVYPPGSGCDTVASLLRGLVDSPRRAVCLARVAEELPELFGMPAMVRGLLEVYEAAMQRPVAPRLADIDRGAIRRWHVYWGRQIHRVLPPAAGRFRILGVPGWLLKRIVASALKAAVARILRRDREWHCAARPLWESAGRVSGCVSTWWRRWASQPAGQSGDAARLAPACPGPLEAGGRGAQKQRLESRGADPGAPRRTTARGTDSDDR